MRKGKWGKVKREKDKEVNRERKKQERGYPGPTRTVRN